MFLSGDRILVYTNQWSDKGDMRVAQTGTIVIDIEDRKEPVVVQHKLLDGSFVSARMIGTDVYTVLNNTMHLPYSLYEKMYDIEWTLYDDVFDIDWDSSVIDRLIARERLQDIYRPFVKDAIASMGARSILPELTHEDGSTEKLMFILRLSGIYQAAMAFCHATYISPNCSLPWVNMFVCFAGTTRQHKIGHGT